MRKVIIIIPARYGSTRLPGKPLRMLGGKLLIQRVYEQAAKVLPDVVVATDDHRVADAVKAFGGRVIISQTPHANGTSRVAEAVLLSGSDAEVVVNLQGDEPLIMPEHIVRLIEAFDDDKVDIATLVVKYKPEWGIDALCDPNTPKVEIDADDNAITFSRSVIPYTRSLPRGQWPAATQYYTHVGVYAYRADTLKRIAAMPLSPSARAESLEQLTWIYNGLKIKTIIINDRTIGIDTADDIAVAAKLIEND